MMTEDWLCSKVKLCQLITDANVDLCNVQDQVVINTQSYPQPQYNPSSIFLTLEAFSGIFDELQDRRSDVKINYINQNALGLNPVETDVHHFADMLSRDILHAAVRKQDTQSTNDHDQICNISQSDVSKWTMSDQEKLAKRLAAEICNDALEELASHSCPVGRKSEEQPDVVQTRQTYEHEIINEIHSEPASYLCSSMHPCEQEGPTTEIDNIYHRRSTTNPTALDNMALLGSLDYPDAPPSTPLIPEMIKSRASFTRKLKSGLAKEFLPSTPPSTPKDQQCPLENKMPDGTVDKSEFMIRLMRSLSLACSQIEEDIGTENNNNLQGEISDYAAQLSADIIHCITVAQAGNNRFAETPIRDVQGLADHLAEDIIMTSISEVMRNKREHKTRQEIPSYFENTTQALRDTLLSESMTDIPPVEAFRALAERLITSAFVQAFSELGSCSLHDAASKHIPDPASEIMPWNQRNDQNVNTGSHITNSHQTQTSGCSYMKSEPNYSPNSRPGTVEHSFAESIVQEVLKWSLREASNCSLRCKQVSSNSDRQTSCIASQAVMMRAFISETLCHDTQELQCVLLWAAASQMGTSILQIDLMDEHIQQQFCSLALQAQFHGWTVGHLMTSLLQYCEDLQTASRGHSKISTILLGNLLLTQS